MNPDNRMTPFIIPYKGLRNALLQFSLQAGKTDYSDKKQVSDLYTLGNEVFLLFSIHEAIENKIVFDELESRCTGASLHIKQEQEKLRRMEKDLRLQLKQIYHWTMAGRECSEMGEAFYLDFSRFHAMYLTHVGEEERIIHPLLWQYFTDAELKVLRIKIMADIDEETMLSWFRFILPALSERERVHYLAEFEITVSKFLFNRVLDVIRNSPAETDFSLPAVHL